MIEGQQLRSGASLDSGRVSALSDDDLHLFNEGTHSRLYHKLGAHPTSQGTRFSVWAPDAERVTVSGDFNGWDSNASALSPVAGSGIWSGTVRNAGKGDRYKYHITSRHNGYQVLKADPFAFLAEQPPSTASVVWDLAYPWNDSEWMKTRRSRSSLDAPISIYEVHPGSWRRVPEDNNRPLTYREMARWLVEHAMNLRFTHVEFLPLMEHPFYGSWGYQISGYFAASSRYGTPQDLMFLIDTLHQNGIGVILDWVPSHFPNDEHGLGYFDGSHLYEHRDSREGFHPDWKSLIFNYGRREVASFLLSSALFWLDLYHVDGLRLDAVASMLYRDYSRKPGEWIPNVYGGRENLEAVAFLKQFNAEVYRNYPDVQTIAEESTSWPMVSRPAYSGGLGFGLKWDMGWMNDTLRYMSRDPVHRKFHHGDLAFRSVYAFHENFVLPLSHDEVAHGKGSLLAKMPGDDWQKFANLRLLFGYMFAQPGKKLIFMGAEFGQWQEWDHDRSLDWHLADTAPHRGVINWVRDLNSAYRSEPALHELDCDPGGFEWIDASDSEQSVITFLRKGRSSDELVLAAFNFTPLPRHGYRVGVPRRGRWRELMNSDAALYGGSNQGNMGGVLARPEPWHGREFSIEMTIPPLGLVLFKYRDAHSLTVESGAG